jgi:SAM-dependent methyltransferase/uncharacterized protein YbaR (Trm112 family)
MPAVPERVEMGPMLDLLRCPYCAGAFGFDEVTKPDMARAEFGLLRCHCSTFPVIDGIPIIMRDEMRIYEHTTGTPETEGVAVDELVRMLGRGEAIDALHYCLTIRSVPRAWRKRLGWRLGQSRMVKRLAGHVARMQFERQVLARRDDCRSRDVLEYFYRPDGPLNPDVGHYFAQRLTQPRHLAALALAATVPGNTKPVLDIACGVGHLAHYFNCREDSVPLIGLDLNFFQIWIARHFVAPQSQFVCANADDGLPFADDCFSVTFCSDAYHYIKNFRLLLAEIERCAPGRMVMLTRVGNADVMPNEGVERSIDAYLGEFGLPAKAFDEDELVKSYLHRADPFDAEATQVARMRERKWLSFAWNVPEERRTIRDDAVAPHAVGAIEINPIYKRAKRPDGSLGLRFEFPTAWYAYENHSMLEYHPLSAELSAEQLLKLSDWRKHDSLRALVDSFVLIGAAP